MCGIGPNELCRWSEALPGQFGFTKQLVFRVALPHITLLLISVSYAMFGCAVLSIFDYHESGDQPDREAVLRDLDSALTGIKDTFARQLLNIVRTGTRSENISSALFNAFATNLSQIYEQQQSSSERPPSFLWNLFFSATWLTSIGYGENAPRGIGKRIFCMLYLAFGIPLFLITLADLAKFCTEAINRFYTECIKLHFKVRRWYRRKQRRQVGEWVHLVDAENGQTAPGRLGKCRPRNRRAKSLLGRNEEEVAEFLWKHLEKTHFVEVPFSLVYLLLVGYILFAAWAVAQLEQWEMEDGLYFIVMSVLTIGFGDMVPKNSDFILPILVVILVGLIVATTFIDMVGAYYIDRLHFFGRKMDAEDPLEWLKAVQQRRIEAMKREAMRRLFETATAMWRFQVMAPPPLLPERPPPSPKKRNPELLPPPRGIVAFHVTADSVTLKWEPPLQILLDGRKFWYTLSWKPRTPQRMCPMKVVDFVRQNRYVIMGLRSFTLYEFSVRISTSEGTSRPARCQEYTEPCTVPQLLQMDAISAETATISWRAPKKNNGPEQYFLLFTQEPAPQFQFWRRFEVGKSKRFTLTDLHTDTRYIVCVFAAHNFGLAAMSRSLRFKTRTTDPWWLEEEEPPEKTNNPAAQFFLAPPALYKWVGMMGSRARRPSLREPSIGEHQRGTGSVTHKSSLQSGEYQDRS